MAKGAGLVGCALLAFTLSASASGADPGPQPGIGQASTLWSLAQAPATNLAPTSAGPQPSQAPAAAEAVTTVASVDLQRYGGLWYEIARVPAWFQSGCVRNSTARYQLREDGRIQVTNTCLRRNGSQDEARGIARITDRSSNARLQVSFVSFLGWRPFWGDYWIIGLDPDYRWAVIGDPRRRYGWILSRTPVLDPATLKATFEILERNGYQRSRFVLTPQADGS